MNVNMNKVTSKNKNVIVAQSQQSRLAFGENYVKSISSTQQQISNYYNVANSLAIINKAGLQFNKNNQLSFGATFWQSITAGASAGVAAGGAGGAKVGGTVDISTGFISGGTITASTTTVGSVGGGIVGGLAGAVAHFTIKNIERLKKEEQVLKQSIQEIEERQKAADEKATAQLKEIEKQQRESLRINKLNQAYETKELEIKQGFGLGKIAGYHADKADLNELFLSPFVKSMESTGVYEEVPNGILLYGVTGNGKTTMALGLAEQALQDKFETNFYKLEGKPEKIVDDLYDIREASEREFNETGQRTIVFIDEFDNLVPKPGSRGYDPQINGQVKDFLNDCSDYGITVIAATNHPRNLEDAFLINDKRFPAKTVIETPTKQDIQEILQYYLNEVTDNTVKYDELANSLQTKSINTGKQYTCSAIETITKKAKRIAKRKERYVSQNDLLDVIQKSGPDIDKAAMAKFKDDFEYVSNGMTYDEYLANKNK